MYVGKFHSVGYDQKQTTIEIKDILVDNQLVLLMLLRGYQGVQDKTIGCRAYNSDDYNKALKIQSGTT